MLEGTDLYLPMQDMLFAFAKAKGDYQGRLDSLTELYKDVEGADISKELVADLIGDYLFTDADFINRLSTENRTLFEKIFDEIKYLCRVVSAGSKEARELEKAKKAFEDAYRASGKMSGDTTKYSLENGNKRKYNKRSKYSETETLFLRWENGSAPVGEVKKFVRYGKTHYYEKNENGCVELSKSQYNERNGVYAENIDRRTEREAGEAYDHDGSTQRGSFGDYNSHRDSRGNATVFGQAIRAELPDVTAGSVSSTFGYNNGNGINQTEYNEEASEDSGASFITFSNDYATIRNFMKDGDTNTKPTSDPDIRRSLSNIGETPKKYGNYNVYGKNVTLETAPVKKTQLAAGEVTPGTDVSEVGESPAWTEEDEEAEYQRQRAESLVGSVEADKVTRRDIYEQKAENYRAHIETLKSEKEASAKSFDEEIAKKEAEHGAGQQSDICHYALCCQRTDKNSVKRQMNSLLVGQGTLPWGFGTKYLRHTAISPFVQAV